MDYDSEKLGKEVRQLSKSEIETNKYREKKGLPPMKKKCKKWKCPKYKGKKCKCGRLLRVTD